MDLNAALIKRRLVEKLGPGESAAAGVQAGVQTVDLSSLLAIADDAGFVRESYKRVLGRECDVGGFVHYRELLRNHYPRRAVIVQLMESAEAKGLGRRYVGLWDRAQEGHSIPGGRWLAALKLSVWNRSRRLFEFFLRVSRVESIELKLDYVLQESALQSERGMAKLDHTLFTISDKVDRYVADLVVKQGELTALVAEGQRAQAGRLDQLEKATNRGRGDVERLERQISKTAAEAERATAALTGRLHETQGSLEGSLQRLAAENQSLRVQLAEVRGQVTDVRAQQRPPIFQAGADVLVTEVDGFLLGIPSQEWRLGAYYALRGLPEPGTTRLWASWIEPGMVVVDVGTHIGIFTLYALRRLSGHGRVYCFEPTPRTFALLRDNVQVNGYLETGVARMRQVAISDRAGQATFTAYGANSGHNTLFGAGTGGEGIEVETVTLDEALAGEERVDLIKIDAEGSEPLVLRGMTRILAQNPGLRIIVEFAPEHLRRGGIEPLQWFEELTALGLRVQRIEDVTGELLTVDPAALEGCISWNLLLSR